MAIALDVVDLGGVHAAHTAVHRHGQILPRPPGQLANGLLQLLRERKVRHRLEHIVQRPHRVSLDGVLRHIGNENQLHLAVHSADTAGRLHTVQLRHLHIQKNNVIDRPVFFQNFQSIGEHRHLKQRAILPCAALHIACQLFADRCLVLDDCNADHASSASQRSSTAAIT